jgi:hypothetical protein
MNIHSVSTANCGVANPGQCRILFRNRTPALIVGRASRPAAAVHARLFRCAKSGSWRTRPRGHPDLEVRPTTFRSISRHSEKYAALGIFPQSMEAA